MKIKICCTKHDSTKKYGNNANCMELLLKRNEIRKSPLYDWYDLRLDNKQNWDDCPFIYYCPYCGAKIELEEELNPDCQTSWTGDLGATEQHEKIEQVRNFECTECQENEIISKLNQVIDRLNGND